MNATDLGAATLTAIGGLNWGLVGLGRFDLVAKLTGNDFGETNAASRVVYTLVGAAAAYQISRLARAAGS
jgi:uncharacterized membrane protein YuzA (DUF378 family)